MTGMDGKVSTKIYDGIGEVHFFHPRSNSLPGKLLEEIASAIQDFGQNPQVKVVLLKSEGDKVFCGGASFDELQAIKNEQQGHSFFMGFAHIILAIRSCPKFVVTRVQGKAVGGGVGLIAASDYALALDAASIRLSEYALGFGPFVISAAVERKIGMAAFGSLSIDTEWKDAEWAKQAGLYAQIFSTPHQLDENLSSLLKRLVGSNPEATARLKAILWENTDHWPDLLVKRAALSSYLTCTDFVQSAIAAVQGKK